MTGMDAGAVRAFELETWTRCADSYLDTFAVLTSTLIPRLREAAEIESGSRVLDLGSGPGNVARALSAAGAEVVGIDFSQQMVDHASKANPGITFKRADAEEIPEDDNTFDAVISNFVVHHLADPVQVFSEVARVLKPGGRFAFVVWGPVEEQSSFGAFFGAVGAHHDLAALPQGPLFGITDHETFATLVESGGLTGLELSKHRTVWKCETLRPIVEGCWDFGHIGALPRETQDRIRATMEENCKPFASAEGYVFPHSAILGCTSKP